MYNYQNQNYDQYQNNFQNPNTYNPYNTNNQYPPEEYQNNWGSHNSSWQIQGDPAYQQYDNYNNNQYPNNQEQYFNPNSIAHNFDDWYQRDVYDSPHLLVKERNVEEITYQLNTDPLAEWMSELNRNQNGVIISGNQNMANFINKQIIMVESNRVKDKLFEMTNNNQKYNDKDFPGDQKCLIGEYKLPEGWKKVKWSPISNIIKNYKLFDNMIHPNDIKQGSLGTCYFLAPISSLAQYPHRILDLFILDKQNPSGYFAVKMLFKGRWKIIELDELIPEINGQIVFTKAVNDELWVTILEKALAKLYSSYMRIKGGYHDEAIHTLTGAHLKLINFSAKTDRDKEFEYLLEATKMRYAMMTSSRGGKNDEEDKNSGIVFGHAYTLLGVYNLDYKGNTEKLFKLRNPWGHVESKMDWRDSDPKWDQVSQEQKQRIGFKVENEGIFFINMKDFFNCFYRISVAEINDNASYIYSTQKSTVEEGSYFKVTIYEAGNYSFQINQTDSRCYTEEERKVYRYVNSTLKFAKVLGNDEYEELEGISETKRTLFKKHYLQPGEYMVWGRIQYNKTYEKDYDLTLAVYADYVCEVQNVQVGECEGFEKIVKKK